MANIIFRLPGREQYSYAEVSVTHEEIDGPEGEAFLSELLANTLASLNLTYPTAEAQPAAQAAPADSNIPSCAHGPRKHAKGQSARGQWQALFCTQPKGPSQCQAIFLKTGEPGWQW